MTDGARIIGLLRTCEDGPADDPQPVIGVGRTSARSDPATGEIRDVRHIY
jgi:hypothetical protein